MQPQSRFINYIIAGVKESLARVEAAEYAVPEIDRQQAWHLLSFALKVEEAWPVTRELLLALAPKMELAGFREEWIPYLEQGLSVCESLGNQTTQSIVAELSLHLGSLRLLQRKYNDALDALQKSKQLFNIDGNRHGEGRALNQLALLANVQHNDLEAQHLIDQALNCFNDDPERGMTYRLQGLLAIKQKQWQEAEQHHRVALAYFEDDGDHRKIAWGLQNLAYAYRGQKKI